VASPLEPLLGLVQPTRVGVQQQDQTHPGSVALGVDLPAQNQVLVNPSCQIRVAVLLGLVGRRRQLFHGETEASSTPSALRQGIQGQIPATRRGSLPVNVPVDDLCLTQHPSHDQGSRLLQANLQIAGPLFEILGELTDRGPPLPLFQVAATPGQCCFGSSLCQTAQHQRKKCAQGKPAQVSGVGHGATGLARQSCVDQLEQQPEQYRHRHRHVGSAGAILALERREEPVGHRHSSVRQTHQGEAQEAGDGTRRTQYAETTLTEPVLPGSHAVGQVATYAGNQKQHQQTDPPQPILQRRQESHQIDEIAEQMEPPGMKEHGRDRGPGLQTTHVENEVPRMHGEHLGPPELPGEGSQHRPHQEHRQPGATLPW